MTFCTVPKCGHPRSIHRDGGSGICLDEECKCNHGTYVDDEEFDSAADGGSVEAALDTHARVLLAHIPIEFALAVGKVMQDGLKEGRQPGDWKDLGPGPAAEKLASALRHLANAEYAAAAANCLILWWHFDRAPG